MAEPARAITAIPAVAERTIADGGIDALVRGADRPFVVRGVARDWPLVRAGIEGGGAGARDYLLAHARDRQFAVNVGAPGGGERLFYDESMGMNFRAGQARLADIFGGIAANESRRDAPAIYLSSIDIHDYFDGLHEANHADLGDRATRDSIWIGTRTRIAAHNDVPDNLAVCAVGQRRFTLFPPEQFVNLYLGPLENTPAGRPVSMVDFAAPDRRLHPRFDDAIEQAQVAELEAGDALFVPSMWYHHVEALSGFNVLINYWWRESPRFLGHPEDALNHAILAIRDLPDKAKARWKDLFDHYVFGDAGKAAEHLPEGARGILDPLDAEHAGRIRANLLRSLSR